MPDPRPVAPDPGSVQLTSVRALAVAALLGGFVGWLIAATPQIFGEDPPLVPWTGPIALASIAAVVGVLAWGTYGRIHRRHERVDPQRAVGLLVLGKATALSGAMIAAGYAVFGGSFLTSMSAPLPRERFTHSVVAVVTGIAVCVAGLLLERACRVPKDDPDGRDPRDDRLDRDRRDDDRRADS